jgi:hypothetical protein
MIGQIQTQLNFDQWSWLLPWLIGLSAIMFFVSIFVVWQVLIRLPEDYLLQDEPHNLYRSKSKLINLAVRIVRNVLGAGFLLVGIVMLFTPGQGILSIIVGIELVEFPGKRKLIRKIVAQPKVFNAINRIRNKANKPRLAAASKPTTVTS